MQPVKWGVISTAKIGTVQVLPAMANGEGIELAAIASRNQSTADEAALALGIRKAYGSYEALLEDPEIEAIYNPLPNHLHVPWTVKAMEAGKHVLCEKPIALTAAEAETLLEVRDRTGKMVEEAFMVRHAPQWLRVVELVRAGRIGELRAIQGVFSYFNDDPDNIRNMVDIGGGGIYDIGCYPITTSRLVVGAEPTRVVSLVQRDPAMKTDRLASALMEFPGGIQANWVCSTQLVPYQRMHFMGTTGRIEIEIPFNAPNDMPCRIFIDDGGDKRGGSVVVEEIPTVDQYTLQGEMFSRAIRDGAEQVVPLENSIANMRVIDAMFASEKSGGWVDI
jgi:predicted dehydrogenase